MPDANKDAASAFQLILAPERAALIAGAESVVRVLARMQAPAAPRDTTAHRPLHLALVLDRSGSMNGQPLDEAKRCARNMIDSLAPDDRAAIFAFDENVQCVAPLTPAADKLALSSALASIEVGGTTNLHGGWRAGADELSQNMMGQDVHRVVLLSDGCANAGVVDLEQIALQCKTLARNGVTTSTYGLGAGFNETLMLAMAATGRGNAYYGQTAADLADPFATEFALLTNLCARGLVLKVHAPDGVGVKLRNAYEPVPGETAAWLLPDLAFAAEAWAVLEFTFPATDALKLAGEITVSVQAATPDSAPVFLMAAFPALVSVDAAQWNALPVDVLAERRVMELDAGDALEAMRAAVEADNWALAQSLADAAQQRFAQLEWATAILATMQRLIASKDKAFSAKEASYARRSLNVRLSSLNEGHLSDEDAQTVRYLRRRQEQGRDNV